MRIAVTYDEDGNVFGHFGHTKAFKVYDTEGDKVVKSLVIHTDGEGYGALACFLSHCGVSVLICGGIGGGAIKALSEAGIAIYGGVTGSADAAVDALLDGNLKYNPNEMCSHHGEGHSCGEHGCGAHEHSHGHDCGGCNH